MRLLLFSDLRLARRDNPTDLFQLTSLAASQQVDALCSAGNLFVGEEVSRETLVLLRECLAGLGPTPVLIAPGSTDSYHAGSPYHELSWSHNVHIFTEPRFHPFTLRENTFWGAAHVRPVHQIGFLDGFTVPAPGNNFALFHGSEQTAYSAEQVGYTLDGGPSRMTAPFDKQQITRAGFRHAFVGQLQSLLLDQDFTYPGAAAGFAGGRAVLVTIGANGSVLRQGCALAEPEPQTIRLAGPEQELAMPWIAELLDGAAPSLSDVRHETVVGRYTKQVAERFTGRQRDLLVRLGRIALREAGHPQED